MKRENKPPYKRQQSTHNSSLPSPHFILRLTLSSLHTELSIYRKLKRAGLPGGSDSKELTYSAGDRVRSLGREDPLEKGMATHSSTLAWRIPWTEDPGRLQSMGLQRAGHSCATNTTYYYTTHDY